MYPSGAGAKVERALNVLNLEDRVSVPLRNNGNKILIELEENVRFMVEAVLFVTQLLSNNS